LKEGNMKRPLATLLVTLAFLAVVALVWAQSFTPPPVGAYIKPTAGGAWTPATTTSTSGGQGSFVPPPQGLYCKNNSTNQWVPCISLGTTDANGNTGLAGQLPVANGTGGFIWTTIPAAVTPNNANVAWTATANTAVTAPSLNFLLFPVNTAALTQVAAPNTNSIGNMAVFSGTAQHFSVVYNTAVPAGNTYTWQLWKNGVVTPLTCSITGAAQRCTDSTDTTPVVYSATPDVLQVMVTCTGTCTSGVIAAHTVSLQIQ
jgi:hypothetical protein